MKFAAAVYPSGFKVKQGHLRSKAQQGFTLVELMISMTLGLILLLIIGTAFVSSRQAFREQEDNARIQESGRFALEFIGRNIKQAGHAEVPFGGIKAEFEGTAIRGTSGAAGVADTVTIQYDGAIGDQDCEGAGFTAADITAQNIVIQNSFNIDATNAELRCDGQFVAALTEPVPTSGSVLLENVEDLQLLYGIDTTGEQSVDQYVAAPAVPADWGRVIAVRVCVLIRSDKTNIVSPGYYLDCNGTSVAIPADRRLRRAFTATFNLRNRVNIQP
ncbi:MAG: PilW family protein [Nitrosomonas sp.]|nr:PilW family protein [Nitrosomonas sp.]MBP6076807.1 PilW family protein [Nitrosomonas sp.]